MALGAPPLLDTFDVTDVDGFFAYAAAASAVVDEAVAAGFPFIACAPLTLV